MNEPTSDKQIAILADDFTGANDAGVSLAQRGMTVDVALSANYVSTAQARIYNSDSRALTASDAAQRVTVLTQKIVAHGAPQWLVKKIDSTLRGNVGAEVAAMLQACKASAAIIAPAFPAAGRITRNGQCFVHERLLTDTEFASDPKTPVTSADIGMLLAAHSRAEIRYLHAADVAAALANASVSAPLLLVVDAQSDAELDEIVAQAESAESRPLLVGSAGLCDALARRLNPCVPRTVLAVVGSMSEIAQQQLAWAAKHPRVEQVFIDINTLFTPAAAEYRQHIVRILVSGRHCLVHTCPDTQARHQIAALCEQQGVSRSELGECICAFLGELTRDVLREAQPDALYLSGGDVAVAAAHALGAKGFSIRGRAAGCVPWGYFSGCLWQRPVMTKAGGFGDETTLLKVLHFIEEKSSD
ncbi:four-carbon acid sugar kinase family protein [Kosakonia sp. ML.JS2a]|uniref:D-threonate kinase n=1 Tax=Kosakonia sp. ML.JS2a TaxID=2980557 RepID=UPI0021D90BBD|nr:four-carbon acid sugar kinase family protein [Kosakonia sp. ML.JS2a]UXY08854.1 four-carbon acid sugar kinase family protein [Kosakonia sp. ML.JS2a]